MASGADCSFGIYLAHPLVLQGLLLGQHAGVLAWVRRAPEVLELAVLLRDLRSGRVQRVVGAGLRAAAHPAEPGAHRAAAGAPHGAVPEPGCVVSEPVTILQVDSINDQSVPYRPGDKGREWPPATVQVARLRAVDGATGPATVITRGALRLSTWHGKDGTRVAFAVYGTGGHLFPQASGDTPSGGAIIWAFVTNLASTPGHDRRGRAEAPTYVRDKRF